MNLETCRREILLARDSFPTALDFLSVERTLDLPKKVSGLIMIDIGSGLSNAVVELRKNGAKAFAVDYRFKNIVDLNSDADDFLADEKLKNQRNEQLYFILSQSPNLKMQELENLVDEGEQDYIQKYERNKHIFLSSLENERKMYVAAIAGSLPFRDSSVDFCFSLQCISRFLISDRYVFNGAVSEALRILKPGGQLQLQPWISDQMEWSKEERRNGQRLIENLVSKNIPVTLEMTQSISPMLR